ncbi:MAG: hypothetical protein ACJAYU_005398 [Bradymonadia bacterium]|jgi:hypothetical protein
MKRTLSFTLISLLAACGTGPTNLDSGVSTPSDIAVDSLEADTVEDMLEPDTVEDTPEPDTVEDTPPPDVMEPDTVEDTADPDVIEPDAGDDTGEPDVAEDTGGDTAEDTGEDTGEDTASDAGTYCGAVDSEFPDFRTGCEVAEDCAPVFHQRDCCGTEAAIAVLNAQLSEFNTAEDRCRDEFPACRCLAGPTQTDDGVTVDSLDDFEVACERGACVSVGRGPSEVICEDQIPTTFPGFDSSCEVYDDCVAIAHQTDCCGNQHMVGVNRDYAEPFGIAESSCRATYPLCGCPAGPASTDAGTFALTPEVVEAQCREGVCWTYVPL